MLTFFVSGGQVLGCEAYDEYIKVGLVIVIVGTFLEFVVDDESVEVRN